MDDIIQRFREEYSEKDIDWEALGQNDAKVWVQSASLRDLQRLVQITDHFQHLSVNWLEIASFWSNRWTAFMKQLEDLYEFQPDVNWHASRLLKKGVSVKLPCRWSQEHDDVRL